MSDKFLLDTIVSQITYTVVAESFRAKLEVTGYANADVEQFWRHRKWAGLTIIRVLSVDSDWHRLRPVFQRHCRKWIHFLKREKENQNQNKITYEHNQTQAGI